MWGERKGGRGGERVGDGDGRGVEREGGETEREGVERKLELVRERERGMVKGSERGIPNLRLC